MPLTRASAAAAAAAAATATAVSQPVAPEPSISASAPNHPPPLHLSSPTSHHSIQYYSPEKSTHISLPALGLLRTKQASLPSIDSCDPSSLFMGSTRSAYLKSVPPDNPTAHAAFRHLWRATYAFAHEDAGTAVCISSDGKLLTCAHCITENEREVREIRAELRLECLSRAARVGRVQESRRWWLLSGEGKAVRAFLIAWDEHRDLALLKIDGIHSQPITQEHIDTLRREQITQKARRAKRRRAGIPKEQQESRENSAERATAWEGLPFVGIASSAPELHTPMVCVGHPGSEDFEADRSGVMTDYPVICASAGRFEGYASGQDRENNSDLGAFQSSCWTYWGHSGAPLAVLRDASGQEDGPSDGLPLYLRPQSREDVQLVGLHSSWDDETGMRRGVGVEAIRAFLKETNRQLRAVEANSSSEWAAMTEQILEETGKIVDAKRYLAIINGQYSEVH